MEPGKPLPVESLYQHFDPATFEFQTTAELEGADGIPGQDRAAEAIEFGTAMPLAGYNLFILGSPGSGRHDYVHRFLRREARAAPAASDWCYVNNFEEPKRPLALELPAGRGVRFREDIEHLIEDARTAVPAAFESEDFQTRRQSIEEEFKEQQEKALEEVQRHAREHGIGLMPTPAGFAFAPLKDGETLSPEEFQKLPQEQQEQFQRESEEVGRELRKVLQSAPQLIRQARGRIRELEREVALLAIGGLIDDLREKYRSLDKVVAHLGRIQDDIVDNVKLFTRATEQKQQMQDLIGGHQGEQRHDDSPAGQRYRINVLIDNSKAEGAPVVFEDQPTLPYLVGRIEHQAQLGALVTDFSLIRGGSLHQANGGYLVLDALKLLVQPYAWEGLKLALKSREIRIRSLAEAFSLLSTVSLDPEPIPLHVKVVLLGGRELYYLLQTLDPEFDDLFKVAADFEDQIERNQDNAHRFARLLGDLARRENLRPLDRGAVARALEESSRHAGDTEKLSARIRHVEDLIREAHFWTLRDGRETISARDIQHAIDAQTRRASRIRDRVQEAILRDTLLIDTEGSRIGQVNGLAVAQLGDTSFGWPNRISARVSLGGGEVVDIEREVEMGGPIHSKGVLILSGFLRSHYVDTRPLSLAASLVFEQSYGGVEGDSASAAELCALLSAVARVPIRQGLAITGSVNQYGEIQAIGGVNEKVEGFFDICRQRGLDGRQGVVIPASNVKHLMLKQEVRDAVREGRFHIYPAVTIDDCLGLLTGKPAGVKDDGGDFPPGTVNQMIRERLLEFADERRRYVMGPKGASRSHD
jgi:lon-related putative ATP-dependent protease